MKNPYTYALVSGLLGLSIAVTAVVDLWANEGRWHKAAQKKLGEWMNPAPDIINWVDVVAEDPQSGRRMYLQTGLRRDGVLVWRTKP